MVYSMCPYALNNALLCLYGLLRVTSFEKAAQKTGVIQSGPNTAVTVRSSRDSGVIRRDAPGFMEKKRCMLFISSFVKRPCYVFTDQINVIVC